MSTEKKGPSTTMKGQMDPSHLKRWKTSNLSFPAERAPWTSRSSYKRHIQDWKTLRLMQVRDTPYARFPANLRGALADLMIPLTKPDVGFCRDARAESGEIVQVAS